jgi:aerobic carbon-monoxide dehydrogenase small subunit
MRLLHAALFLMLAANMLEQRPEIGDQDMLDLLSSNLCRCTVYPNISNVVRPARDEVR